MKNINIKTMFLQVVCGLFLMMTFVACEEENEVYSNPNIIDTNIDLTYEQIITYPFKAVLTSEMPSYTISNSVYAFSVLEVQMDNAKLEAGAGNFELDAITGVMTVDNTEGFLKTGGVYAVNVGVANVNGMLINEKAFTLTVLDIPMSYTIDNETVATNYLENAEVATITFQDTSENGDVLEDISYSIFDAPEGFSIDKNTGVISKTSDAISGVHNLTVNIDSNLGTVSFENVLEVTVGDAPELDYLQKDGSTILNSVLMSPWSVYTSQIPVIDGMEAVSFELILPETINASDVSISAEGIISIAPVNALSEETHSLGVIATNASGISAAFNNVFYLLVASKWEDPVFFEDFNSATIESATVASYNKKLSTYSLNATPLLFDVINISAKNYFVTRLGVSKSDSYNAVDAALVLELQLLPEWKKMRVSFNEGFGYANNRLESFHRTFQTSNTIDDLKSGTFTAANWSNTINFDDEAWSTGDSWKATEGDVSLNRIVNKEIVFDASSTSVFLNWRIEKYAELEKAGGSAFLIDEIKVEVATSFEAEEK